MSGLIGKTPGRGRVLRLLLAALLGLQALGTAAHFQSSHFAPVEFAGPEVSARLSGSRPPANAPADCLICDFLSLLADALLPAGVALPIAATLFCWSAAIVLPGQIHWARACGWRSRAPPAGS